MLEVKGGCACGQCRYESENPPQFAFHCQCNQCQKLTGGGHASQFMLDKQKVAITGELRFYQYTADDGHTVQSGFCPQCGSPLYTESSGYPGKMFIHAGSLDDPSGFEPQCVIWTASGHAWDYLDPGLEKKAGE